MQLDGNLAMVDNVGRVLWDTKTSGNPGTKLYMQNGGGVMMYGPKGFVKQLTSAKQFLSCMSGVENLFPGDSLISFDRKYELKHGLNGIGVSLFGKMCFDIFKGKSWKNGRLIMQADGILVFYDSSGSKALWNSRTEGNPGTYLCMQNGALVIMYGPDKRGKCSVKKNGWVCVGLNDDKQCQEIDFCQDGKIACTSSSDQVFSMCEEKTLSYVR